MFYSCILLILFCCWTLYAISVVVVILIVYDNRGKVDAAKMYECANSHGETIVYVQLYVIVIRTRKQIVLKIFTKNYVLNIFSIRTRFAYSSIIYGQLAAAFVFFTGAAAICRLSNKSQLVVTCLYPIIYQCIITVHNSVYVHSSILG